MFCESFEPSDENGRIGVEMPFLIQVSVKVFSWPALCRCNGNFFLIDQLFPVRLFFASGASSLGLWGYCWWKSFTNSSAWTSSAYTHWFSASGQPSHLTRYCNLFRYSLLSNINSTSSCLSPSIKIGGGATTSSDRPLNGSNKETWKTLCIRNVWGKFFRQLYFQAIKVHN